LLDVAMRFMNLRYVLKLKKAITESCRIDIETGAFELVNDTMTASDRLLERYPDAQIWCVRIGHKGVHRFGVGWLSS
jgi:hypothetical protein